MEAFFLAFAVVFLAELGDKTQLVALSLATRYRTVTVLAGITVAYAITNGVSVLVGGAGRTRRQDDAGHRHPCGT
jgi:Ca2+/H+ antiporter, TMEM165/GDT1 family